MRPLLLLSLLLAVVTASALPAVAARVRAPLGSDGRLTLLLLGSDLRTYPPASERMDTIMLVSIEPVSGATTIASLPRDVEGLPLPGPSAPAMSRVSEWSSDRYDGKANALFGSLVARIRARDRVGYEEGVRRALLPLRRTFAYAAGVEIDGVVIAAFGAMRSIANRLGGDVEVRLPLALRFRDCSAVLAAKDGCLIYTPKAPKGAKEVTVRVPADEWLGFARSRKDDHDYARAARGQLLLAGIVRRLRAEGVARALPLLAEIATTRGLVRTDLNPFAAPDLWTIMSRADLDGATRAVFGPTRFAGEGPQLYQVVMKPAPVQAWVAERFPAPGRAGAWPLPFVELPELPAILRPEVVEPPCIRPAMHYCLR